MLLDRLENRLFGGKTLSSVFATIPQFFQPPRRRSVARVVARERLRLDQIGGDLDSVVRGLLKISGRDPTTLDPPAIQFDSAKAFRDLWVTPRN